MPPLHTAARPATRARVPSSSPQHPQLPTSSSQHPPSSPSSPPPSVVAPPSLMAWGGSTQDPPPPAFLNLSHLPAVHSGTLGPLLVCAPQESLC